MKTERDTVEQLFETALILDESERAVFLDHACGANHHLRQEVEELLLADAVAGSFLEHPPVERLEETPTRSANESTTGSIDETDDSVEVKLSGRLKPGEVLLDRFLILRFVAKGGMGEVYEVEDRFLQGVHLALKTIRMDLAHDPALQQRFEREVLVARRVTHINLCPIYDIFRCEAPAPRFLFLTMRFIAGDTLADRLRAGTPLPIEEGLAILRQIVAGLYAIHEADIVHRDIKPNNILLEGSGGGLHLSITDFGLARAFEAEISITGRGVVAGTPAYMAPELFEGRPPSQASDLFALGVVLHEVFAGQKPTASRENITVTASSKLSALRVPSFCTQVISGLLDKAPARRCEAFERALLVLQLKRRGAGTWSRRRFVAVTAASLAVMASGAWWERDSVENALHPLPSKRFVALLRWPATSDSRMAPLLTSVLTAIKSELARAETLDRNLFAISPEDVQLNVGPDTQLKDVCTTVGANLVLAAHGWPDANNFQLVLRVLDPLTNQTLRQKQISCRTTDVTSLPGRAVRAAASLLNLPPDAKEKERMEPQTNSVQAFTAFQQAETFMNQPDDSAIDAAILEYRQAVELDARYAIAHARLARAYTRIFVLRRDPAALELARGNCQVALNLDPNLIEGYLAQSAILDETGKYAEALHALSTALALEPSNHRILVRQGQFLNRMNRWQEAEKAFRRALAEHPNYWLAWNELGFGLHCQAKYREATEAFRAASLAAPANSRTLTNLGLECIQTSDFEGAAEALRRGLAAGHNFDEPAAGMSLLLRYLNKSREALPYARKAVTWNPSDDINWLELADCYLSIKHQKESEDAFRQARHQVEQLLAVEPGNGPSRMLLALYKVKTGEPQDAVPLMNEAEKQAAGDIDSQLYRARVLELIGRRDDALAVLADCFNRGAGDLQFRIFPDMGALRRDKRYLQLAFAEGRSAAKTAGQATRS